MSPFVALVVVLAAAPRYDLSSDAAIELAAKKAAKIEGRVCSNTVEELDVVVVGRMKAGQRCSWVGYFFQGEYRGPLTRSSAALQAAGWAIPDEREALALKWAMLVLDFDGAEVTSNSPGAIVVEGTIELGAKTVKSKVTFTDTGDSTR